ncbi:MAG: DUF4363 family protein [Christensenellaceae bacterium]|jgi:hypothetical protein|nr:DUF4363 family protein [Christensenellaceae bacterium]
MMSKHTSFPLINRIFMCVLGALLLFLFIAPHAYVTGFTTDMREQASKAEAAAMAGDVKAASRAVNSMLETLGRAEGTLRLFINHENVNQLHMAVEASLHLAAIAEWGNMLTELQDALRVLEHMDASETFNIYNLF